jgi:hypothetical protein
MPHELIFNQFRNEQKNQQTKALLSELTFNTATKTTDKIHDRDYYPE